MWRRFLIASVCGVLAGCGAAGPPKNGPRSPDVLLRRATPQRDITAFRATGFVGDIGRTTLRGDAFFFGERPDKVRIDVLGPLGSVVGIFLFADGTLTFIDHKNGRVTSGDHSECAASSLLGAPVSPSQVWPLMVGGVPLVAGAATLQWKDGRYVVSIAGGLQEITYAPRPPYDPQSALWRSGDTVTLEVQFADWHDVPGARIPHRITLVAHDGTGVLLRYQEGTVEINPAIPASAWRVTIPDYPSHALTCP